MNILAVSLYPNRFVRNNNTRSNNRVSFGMRATQPMSDSFERFFAKENETTFKKMADNYLNALEKIAKSNENSGVSFDREYNASPIKSATSMVDKLMREPNPLLEITDRIRATLFIDDPYDLSTLFDKIIPAMNKEGYAVADRLITIEELQKRGYKPTKKELANPNLTKKIPDIDIRLRHSPVTKGDIPKGYEYTLSRQEKSGYEDIQIRFINKNDPTKTKHELLLLFGKNYANAKHIESEEVYSHLRKFKKMSIKFDDKNPESYARKADENKKKIETIFRTEISGKLFMNAREQDYYVTKNEHIPLNIEITPDMQKNIKSLFKFLEENIEKHYEELRKSTLDDIEREKIEAQLQYDMKLLQEIKTGLYKTAKKYKKSC